MYLMSSTHDGHVSQRITKLQSEMKASKRIAGFILPENDHPKKGQSLLMSQKLT